MLSRLAIFARGSVKTIAKEVKVETHIMESAATVSGFDVKPCKTTNNGIGASVFAARGRYLKMRENCQASTLKFTDSRAWRVAAAQRKAE